MKETFFEYDPSEVVLKNLKVETLDRKDLEKFNKLLDAGHYLGASPQVGDMLEQVITYRGEWVALFVWGPCALRLKPREEWIGWDNKRLEERRKLMVQNRRFCILGETRKPNLASKCLALSLHALPDAWMGQFGYKPLLAETFTDPQQFEGTCYKANGWTPLGFTQGFNRTHRAEYYTDAQHPKQLWVKPLHAKTIPWLIGDDQGMPECYQEGIIKNGPGRSLPLKTNQVEALFRHFDTSIDPRSKSVQFHIRSILTLIALGILCGHTQVTQMQRLGTYLTQQQRALLRFPLKKGSRKIRKAPSYIVIYNVLKNIDLSLLAAQINAWLQANEGTLPQSLALDGKSLKDRVHTLALVDHDTGAAVAVSACVDKGHELKEGQKMIQGMGDLTNKVITADALHCQKKLSMMR
jgi:Domain of unknown function (DUF4338)/DDE_Tnp_1-associated